jgi:7-carboxy-7-deazaguanine synthase
MNKTIQYPIIEIFDSIQGEGSWMGIPVSFIRFAGCNLHCSFCDTKDSWNSGSMMTIEQIIDQIHQNHIVLTGGEPTLFDLKPLILKLKQRKNQKIAIETNGTNEIKGDIDWIVCSPKPDAHYMIKCQPNELKYVVDEIFTIDVIPTEYRGKIPIWLQPNNQNLQESIKKSYILVMQNNFLRLGAQLHKIYELK